MPTGVKRARADGFTGIGVVLGTINGGVLPSDPSLNGKANQAGRDKIAWFHSYEPGAADPSAVAATDMGDRSEGGHGDLMAQLMVGDAYTETFATAKPTANDNTIEPDTYHSDGGVAPGASLAVAATCYTRSSSNGVALCGYGGTQISALAGQGVKVVDMSFDRGDIMSAQAKTAAPGVEYALRDLIANDMLGAVSTCDTPTQKDTGEVAGIPYLDSGLQPYVIAATGVVIGAEGQPDPDAPAATGVASDGNAIPTLTTTNATPCGVAAAWCLTAPEWAQVLPVGSYTSGVGVGTSVSAATIAAIGGLVQQAFPWMGGKQIQETLLTTATPLGKGPYPNAKFGWGMVNAAKAVHGPAEFIYPKVYGPFLADIPTGTRSVFANDISGPGGLKVSGDGILVLTGGDTYAGTTEIASGTLEVDGSIASTTTIDAGGNLTGFGAVNADVTNHGTVTSNATSAGHGLVINGALTDGANSTTAVGLGNPLIVKGVATLAGTMEVLGAPKGYTVKSTENLLTAHSLAGTFGKLTFASGVFYTGKLGYTATDVNVALTQVSPTSAVAESPVSTVQTLASAKNLDKALDASNRQYEAQGTAGHADWYHAAGAFLAAPTEANAVASVDSLSGELYADSRAVEFTQSLAIDQALSDRQIAMTHQQHAGLWAQTVGVDGGLSRSGYDAMGYRSGGAMAGVNLPLADGLSVGAAAGHLHTWTSLAGLGGSINAKEDFGAVYGGWLNPNGWYLNGRVSFAAVNDDVTRDLLLGDRLVPLDGSHTDHLTTATLELGKRMQMGASSIAPFVDLTGLRLEQSAFAERGSAVGLAAPAQTHNATLGAVGVRFRQSMHVDGDPAWLSGYVAYRRVLSGADLGMKANFVGLTPVTFRAQGQNLPRNVGTAGANWNVRLAPHWSGFLGAAYLAGSEGAHQVEANAGLRFRF